MPIESTREHASTPGKAKRRAMHASAAHESSPFEMIRIDMCDVRRSIQHTRRAAVGTTVARWRDEVHADIIAIMNSTPSRHDRLRAHVNRERLLDTAVRLVEVPSRTG